MLSLEGESKGWCEGEVVTSSDVGKCAFRNGGALADSLLATLGYDRRRKCSPPHKIFIHASNDTMTTSSQESFPQTCHLPRRLQSPSLY